MAEVREKLRVLWDQPATEQVWEERKLYLERLDSSLSREETYWRQRSQTLWISEGDRNTKFFHQRASNRRRKNRIKGLFDAVGVWQEDDRALRARFLLTSASSLS